MKTGGFCVNLCVNEVTYVQTTNTSHTMQQLPSIYFSKASRPTEDGVCKISMRLRFPGEECSRPLPTLLPHVTPAVWDGMSKARVKQGSPSDVLKGQLEAEKKRIREIITDMPTWDIERFMKLYEGDKTVKRSKDKTNLKLLFEQRLLDETLDEDTTKEDMVAYRSINRYWVSRGKAEDSITLEDTNQEFLKLYLKWLRETTDSDWTARKYLSTLRAVWNAAVLNPDLPSITENKYPFSRSAKDKRFKVPSGKSAKDVRYLIPENYVKLLKFRDELPMLAAKETNLNRKAQYQAWEKAIDAFQFSVLCNGANPVDFVYLTWDNMKETNYGEKYLEWFRSKTANESEPSKQQAPLSPLMPLIEKYSKHGYLFCIFEVHEWHNTKLVSRVITGKAEQEQRRANWQTKAAKRLKEVSRHLGLPNNTLHFGVARTTWINIGESFAKKDKVISYGAGHKSEATTRKNYAVQDVMIKELLQINRSIANLPQTFVKPNKIKFESVSEIAELIKEEFLVAKHLLADDARKNADKVNPIKKPKQAKLRVIKGKKTA
jgi:hypothetical protein